MSNLSKWIDEKAIPRLTNVERLMSVLYTMGIATNEQLQVITGWKELKIRDTLMAIRDMEEIPESHKKLKELLNQIKASKAEQVATEEQLQSTNEVTSRKMTETSNTNMELEKLELKFLREKEKIKKRRDQWLIILRPPGRGTSHYTLGELGMDYVREIRQEFRGKKNHKDNPKRQAYHFFGINEILCRIRRKGVMEDEWLSTREVGQEINYHWSRVYPDKAIPYKPDALLQLGEDRYFVEFDTGSENYTRLRNRFKNTLTLYYEIEDKTKTRLPNEIIWVTTSPTRKKRIEELAQQVLTDFKSDFTEKPVRVPTVYCFLEGEETGFLIEGEIAEPFWDEE